MDEAGVVLAARKRNVSNRERIRFISGERFLFGYVHLVVSRGVEHRSRLEFGQRPLDAFRFRDIERPAVEAPDGVATPLEFGAELYSELASTAEYDHALLHFAGFRA